MITLSEKAAEMIRVFMASENKEGYGLRIGVSGGGCGGYQYEMDVEEAPRADDEVIEENGVRIFIDPESRPMLNGVEVDFVDGEGEEGAGFAIFNPNAGSGGCGCKGES